MTGHSLTMKKRFFALVNFLCRGGILGHLNLKLLTFQDSVPPSSVPNSYWSHRQPLCKQGLSKEDTGMSTGTDSGAAMKRMGIPLWRRNYREAARDNAYRAPVSHSRAAAVGKSHKTSLGSSSLKKKARLRINPPSPEGIYASTTKIFLGRSLAN